MDTQKTSKFFVGSIITFLIIFGLVKVILSTMQDIEKNVVTPASMSEDDIAARIKPVAQAHVGEAPVVVAAPIEDDSVGGGEKVVTQVCAMCHATGMMSSPKLGKAKDWAPRIEQGIETLYQNAINGINMMPARGGRPDLSDDDVKAAVDHMLSLVK
mgnify:FL=1